MRRAGWFAIWSAVSAVVLADESAVRAEVEQVHAAAPVPDEHRRLLAQLTAPQFELREQAEERLQALGASAIPALEAAAWNGEPGVIPRVFRLLERHFVEGCPEAADAAERALERLAGARRPEVMSRARAVLAGNHHLRERRAIAAIREMGGKVDFLSLEDTRRANLMWAWGGAESAFQVPGQDPVRMHIWLLYGWTGGEEGLWHLARLEDSWSARLWGLDITNIRGSGVDLEDVQALAARLPQAQISERGRASLGVSCSPTGPCIVQGLVPGGAAARAGLQVQDEIESIDEVPVASFGDLVAALLDRAPEEEAVIKVRRNQEVLDIPVRLSGWAELQVGQPFPEQQQNPPAGREPLLPQFKP